MRHIGSEQVICLPIITHVEIMFANALETPSTVECLRRIVMLPYAEPDSALAQRGLDDMAHALETDGLSSIQKEYLLAIA